MFLHGFDGLSGAQILREQVDVQHRLPVFDSSVRQEEGSVQVVAVVTSEVELFYSGWSLTICQLKKYYFLLQNTANEDYTVRKIFKVYGKTVQRA